MHYKVHYPALAVYYFFLLFFFISGVHDVFKWIKLLIDFKHSSLQTLQEVNTLQQQPKVR